MEGAANGNLRKTKKGQTLILYLNVLELLLYTMD